MLMGAKEVVENILSNIELGNLYSCMEIKADKTFLFYGHPGIGKTLFTKIINNELL